MNWRASLTLLIGTMVPLPLIALLMYALQPMWPRSGKPGRLISPMLENQDRLRLSTYHRVCETSSECEPPLGCVFDGRSRVPYCTDSECVTDTQCPDDLFCQTVGTNGGPGPSARFCVPVGVRQEGERCEKLPGSKDEACSAGLVCGGRVRSWCGRECSEDGTAPCAPGFFCADTSPKPICLPTCEAQGCPQGQRCVRFDVGVSACALVYGPDCQQAPCPDSRQCNVSDEPPFPGKVWMECTERCGEGFPLCGPGRVCETGDCQPDCTPQSPDPCGEGYHCIKRTPRSPYACQPLWKEPW
jgi:hypothetical protein